jgi:hypothetical protein
LVGMHNALWLCAKYAQVCWLVGIICPLWWRFFRCI